jgi:hypothetical protein
MIEFHLSVDALGKTRFAYSPLAEVASSLRLLGEGRQAYVMVPWLRDVRGSLERLDFELLRTLAPPGRWAPDFLFAWSYNPAITIEQQLDAMSRLPGGRSVTTCAAPGKTAQCRRSWRSCWTTRRRSRGGSVT